MLARSEEKLKKISEKNNCDFYVCDVKNHENVKDTISKIIKKYNKIDVLINNAGIWTQGPLVETDSETISDVIDTNTKGTIYLTKEVLQYMTKENDGQIINIISQAGLYAKEERSIYTASKWAITGFTKSIEKEAAKNKIRVTGIYPGKINTQIFEKMGIQKDMSNAIQTEQISKTIDFIINVDKDISFPEIGIKNINN